MERKKQSVGSIINITKVIIMKLLRKFYIITIVTTTVLFPIFALSNILIMEELPYFIVILHINLLFLLYSMTQFILLLLYPLAQVLLFIDYICLKKYNEWIVVLFMFDLIVYIITFSTFISTCCQL